MRCIHDHLGENRDPHSLEPTEASDRSSRRPGKAVAVIRPTIVRSPASGARPWRRTRSVTPTGQRMGGMSARRWRSMERRARADHAQQLLSILGQLAANGAPVTIDEPACNRARRPRVIVVRGAGWQLVLVGTSALAGGTAFDRARPWLVAGAGRYGPYWWLRLADGEDATDQRVCILALHLHFDVAAGGADIQPAPLGHTHRNWGGVR